MAGKYAMLNLGVSECFMLVILVVRKRWDGVNLITQIFPTRPLKINLARLNQTNLELSVKCCLCNDQFSCSFFPRHTLPKQGYTYSISEAVIINNDQHQHQKTILTNNMINLKIKQQHTAVVNWCYCHNEVLFQ